MLQPTKRELPGLLNGENATIEYIITPYPAMQGIRMAVKIAKAFGGGIGEAISGVDTTDENGKPKDITLDSIGDLDLGGIVSKILYELDEVQTPQLIIEILNGTTRNGVHLTEDAINKCYTQNFGELFLALKFSLEVNFGGFIAALAQGGNTGLEAQDSAE